jgi:hypothetical protein
VGDNVQPVIARVDQLIRFVFQSTPEIFDKEAAAIVGSCRYKGFLELLPREFVSRKRRAGFAANVEDAMAGNSDCLISRGKNQNFADAKLSLRAAIRSAGQGN